MRLQNFLSSTSKHNADVIYSHSSENSFHQRIKTGRVGALSHNPADNFMYVFHIHREHLVKVGKHFSHKPIIVIQYVILRKYTEDAHHVCGLLQVIILTPLEARICIFSLCLRLNFQAMPSLRRI